MALSLLVRRYSTKPSLDLEKHNDDKEQTFDPPEYIPYTPRKQKLGLKFL